MRFRFAHEALSYLINEYHIKEMHIPYYLCDVVRHTLYAQQCKPIFYHIDDSFLPADTFEQDKFVLYPNYFGICDTNVHKLELLYPKLIVDNAHAFYSKPCGFASFNSAYKFNEGDWSDLWFRGNAYNSPVFQNIAVRKKEFLRLDKIYRSTNLLKPDENSNPFCYPYLARSIEEADKLAAHLKNEGKVIYRYWHQLPSTYNEYKFYSRLVSIPLA